MERKTISAEELRKQFVLSKQALSNYQNLGVLTPVPGTEGDANPLYYADEVAVIREALTSCESSIKRLNNIRNNVVKEIFKTRAALAVLQLDEATKQGAVTSIIDSVALFLNMAVPNLKECETPLYWLRWTEDRELDRFIECMSNGRPFQTPQDYCNALYHETEVVDATSLIHVIEERNALEEANEELKKDVEKLRKQLELLSPNAQVALSRYEYGKELTEKQIQGLHKNIFECNFTVRVLNCLKSYWNYETDESIATIRDVVKFKESDLKKFRNFGKNSAAEIVDFLAKYDLTLGMEIVEIDGKYYSK